MPHKAVKSRSASSVSVSSSQGGRGLAVVGEEFCSVVTSSAVVVSTGASEAVVVSTGSSIGGVLSGISVVPSVVVSSDDAVVVSAGGEGVLSGQVD